MNIGDINNFLGDLDIELLDQILKGSFEDCESVLEIGCGQGRNLLYFMKEGYSVFGVDKDPSALKLCNYIAKELGASKNCKFVNQDAQTLPFENGSMDAIICCRVFHFARDRSEFQKIWAEQYRVLKTRGLLFISMDAMMGVDLPIEIMDENKYKFSDNTVRFLLTRDLMDDLRIDQQFQWVEPLKMINYNYEHAQAILVLQKK